MLVNCVYDKEWNALLLYSHLYNENTAQQQQQQQLNKTIRVLKFRGSAPFYEHIAWHAEFTSHLYMIFSVFFCSFHSYIPFNKNYVSRPICQD